MNFLRQTSVPPKEKDNNTCGYHTIFELTKRTGSSRILEKPIFSSLDPSPFLFLSLVSSKKATGRIFSYYYVKILCR